MSDERTPDERPAGPGSGGSGGSDDLQGHDSFYDLSGEFDDGDGGDGGGAGGGRGPGRSGATRGAASPPSHPHPVATRSEVLRAFLTSGTGGALVALAAVLLIVVTLLAVRGNPTDGGKNTAGGSTQSGTHGGATPGGGTGHTGGHTTASPTARPTAGGPEPSATGPRGSGRGGPPPTATPSARPTPGKGDEGRPDRLPVTVLNNTTVHNLAQQAADEFDAGGWPIAHVGNFTGRIPVTTVYFTPGHADEERAANALAAAFPRIGRVLPRYEGLPPEVTGVIVVLAPDWTS